MRRSFPRSLVPTGRKAHLFRGQELNEQGNSQSGPWVKTPVGTSVTELHPAPKGLWQVGTPSWALMLTGGRGLGWLEVLSCRAPANGSHSAFRSWSPISSSPISGTVGFGPFTT